jgi:hypothetical protein
MKHIVRRILGECGVDERDIGCGRSWESFLVSRPHDDPKDYNRTDSQGRLTDSQGRLKVYDIQIMHYLPFSTGGEFEIESILARRIAQQYGIGFEYCDTSPGSDSFYEPTFLVVCKEKEKDIKLNIEKIIQARDELRSRLEKLADFVMKNASPKNKS